MRKIGYDIFTVRWVSGSLRGQETVATSTDLRAYDSTRKSRHDQEREQSTSADHLAHIAEFQESGSNKVYGMISKNGQWYTFWGRRDGPYQTKAMGSSTEAYDVFSKKVAKGYRPFDVTREWKTKVVQNAKF